jgi:hypothetical protein
MSMTVWPLILALLAGCATGTDPGGGNRYGLEPVDAEQAFRGREGREALSFYEREAAADTLRQAQWVTMRDFPHPFFWAAFSLAGSPQ